MGGPEPIVLAAGAVSGRVVVAFSGRRGGTSTGRFAEANLSASVGDDPDAVRENRRRLLEAAGLGGRPLLTVRQGHGAAVVRVGSADAPHDLLRPLDVVADGLVTTDRDVVLMVGAADCLPVVLADPDRAVAVLHVGRRGLTAGLVEAGVGALVDAGADLTATVAFLGPCIGACCYALPPALSAQVAHRYAAAAAVTRDGSASVDLAAATREALGRAGVEVVHADERCTVDDGELFSVRRDGSTGCQAGLVALR